MKLWDALFDIAVIVVLLVLSAWVYELNGRLDTHDTELRELREEQDFQVCEICEIRAALANKNAQLNSLQQSENEL